MNYQKISEFDLLIVGSGVAGLSAAIAGTAAGMNIGILTKGELEQSATKWAQGGVAAVIDSEQDSTDFHLEDTINVGAGLCDPVAVSVLVNEGPIRVKELISLGAVFDVGSDGVFQLAKEGGHSFPRVLHAGGAATGAEIERALVQAVTQTDIELLNGYLAIDLIIENNKCVGISALDSQGHIKQVRAQNVILATGGAGQLYSVTTNPKEATGDGIAMALRAGVAVADMEFMQFHPTALYHSSMPRPLLSEALRGHGAILRDSHGNRFVDELQSRDVVSRAIARCMAEQKTNHVWLDTTVLKDFAQRFPTVYSSLKSLGFDPEVEFIPVAPAAHYLCGGILTDLDGATSLEGLWAAGETACTGVHGANRLGSNSLLEGMVFAPRIIEAIQEGKQYFAYQGAMEALKPVAEKENNESNTNIKKCTKAPVIKTKSNFSVEQLEQFFGIDLSNLSKISTRREILQKAMTIGAGVVRDETSLNYVACLIEHLKSLSSGKYQEQELENLLIVASTLVSFSLTRTESRGSHWRRDFPEQKDDSWRCRIIKVS